MPVETRGMANRRQKDLESESKNNSTWGSIMLNGESIEKEVVRKDNINGCSTLNTSLPLSDSSFSILNKIANRSIALFYAYNVLYESLKDCLVLASYLQQIHNCAIECQTQAQKCFDYIFRHGKSFVLIQEPNMSKIDLTSISRMESQLKKYTRALKGRAYKEKDEKLLELVNELSAINYLGGVPSNFHNSKNHYTTKISKNPPAESAVQNYVNKVSANRKNGNVDIKQNDQAKSNNMFFENSQSFEHDIEVYESDMPEEVLEQTIEAFIQAHNKMKCEICREENPEEDVAWLMKDNLGNKFHLANCMILIGCKYGAVVTHQSETYANFRVDSQYVTVSLP